MVQADGAMEDAAALPNFRVKGFRGELMFWPRMARSPVQVSMMEAIVPVPNPSRATATKGESIQVTTPHQGRSPPVSSARGAPSQSSAALNLTIGQLHVHHLSYICCKLRFLLPPMEAGI